jgi:hypothetical protein
MVLSRKAYQQSVPQPVEIAKRFAQLCFWRFSV